METLTRTFDLTTLLDLTNKLTALVTSETEFLKQMKVSEVAKLQLEKNNVAAALEKQQSALREDVAAKDALTVEQKAELKAAAQSFDTAITKYQEALFKARKVNELVIGKMVELVKDHVMKDRAYSRNGSRMLVGKELAKNTPAIKFNTLS